MCRLTAHGRGTQPARSATAHGLAPPTKGGQLGEASRELHLQAAQALAGQQLARDLLGRLAAHVGDHAVELLRFQVRLQQDLPQSGVQVL